MEARVTDRGSVRPRVDLAWLWRPALLFVSSRALVLLAFVVAGAAQRGLGLRASMTRWDGGFYLGIAKYGYPSTVHGPSRLAFFPGFPLAIRAVETVFQLSVYRASVIVVFAFGLAAACGLWLLTRDLANPEAADRATALFVFAPGSFVLSMGYSEAMFVFCAVATCRALIHRRWLLAGVIGAIGAATRPDGLALVLAAGCAAYGAFRDRHELRAALAVPLIASGFIAVQVYFWAHTKDLFAYFDTERQGWHHGFSTPGTGRIDDIRSVWHTILHGGRPDWNHLVPLVGLIVFVGAFVALARWKPPPTLIGYTIAMAYLAVTSVSVGFRPRLLMATFPLSMALGVTLRRGPWFATTLAASSALLVILTIVTATTRYLVP